MSKGGSGKIPKIGEGQKRSFSLQQSRSQAPETALHKHEKLGGFIARCNWIKEGAVLQTYPLGGFILGLEQPGLGGDVPAHGRG